jgi:hypothetical protein
MSIPESLSGPVPHPDGVAGRLVVRNEFAVVAVSTRTSACGTRLRIEDLRTQQFVELDALELESLAWAHHRDLDPLLDPSAARWADPTAPSDHDTHDKA